MEELRGISLFIDMLTINETTTMKQNPTKLTFSTNTIFNNKI